MIEYKKGENVVTALQYNVRPNGTFSTPALPAEIGTLSETLTDATITDDRTITLTIADNVNPFKLVSARFRNTWATTSAAGLTHTANNADFAAGEWFLDVPDGYFFKIFSPNQSKYLGTIKAGEDQVAFSDTPGTFTMQKSVTGAEAICNSDNTNPNSTVYFNHRSNSIGAWSADAGSHWFMVYDENTYNTNKDSFTETVNSSGYFENNGIWQTSIAAATDVYNQATTSGMTDNTITELKALIDQSAGMRFGVAGNNIPEYLTKLAAAKEAVQTFLDSHVKVTFNFPRINGHDVASQTIYTNSGTTVSELVAALTLPTTFTVDADVAAKTLTENTTMDLTGKWGFPAIEFGRVYRIALRNKAENNCNYFYANASDNKVYTQEGNDADAIIPERFFYFKEAEGSTADAPKVTLHTLAKADNYGFTVASANNSLGTMSETPMVFTVVSNTNASTLDAFGFSLQHGDAAEAHLNDISGKLGVWNNTFSRNDSGSAFKLYSLSDDEIDAIEGVSDEAKAAAKANPNVENISALCIPGLKAELAHVYEEKVGVPCSLGGNVSLPGYVAPTNAAAQTVYNDYVSSEGLTMLTMVEHIGALKAAAYSYATTDGVLCTLGSTDLDARGYLCNNNGQVTNTKAAKLAFDNNNDDFKFCFVTVNGKRYLYNLGADKFMNAFGEKTDNSDAAIQNAADYTWRFNEVPTEIKNLVLYKGAIAHSFTIAAGLTPSNNDSWDKSQVHEGGLSMTNNGVRPIVVSMGITDRGDGNGLIAHYAGKLTDDQVAALTARISDAISATTAAKEAIPAITEEIHIVNHYTPAAKALIDEAASADHQAYLMETGDRQGFVAGMAYTIVNAENKAWGINDEGQCIQAEIGTDNAEYFNWIPAVVTETETPAEEAGIAALALEGTRYTFGHTHDNTTIMLNIDGATEHEIGTSTLGKVTIAGTDYVMTSNDGKATTTAITEINADSLSDAAIIYDLQGRRLAAPARGVNIINGRKVLVK